MKTIKYLSMILVVMLMFSCGYRMVGFDQHGNSKYKYFIQEIVNNSKESDYYAILKESVETYFTNYNSLAPKNEADYILFVTLDGIKTSSTIKSATNQTVSADMTVTLSIKVLDKNDKVVFKKVMRNTDSYRSSSNVSENIDNKNKALKTIVFNILSDFKYEFEEKK
jgi:outer membrane lipopolysaccharide assembly protein LptE/RlpB